MTRKEKFGQVWRKYLELADAAKFSAQRAKEDFRKSDYDFWLNEYKINSERAAYFEYQYLMA